MKKIIKFLILKFHNKSSKIALSSRVSLNTKLGYKVKVLSKARIGQCSIGDYSYIGEECIIERTNIGKFVSIGPQVMCGMGTHPTNFTSTYPGFYSSTSSGAEFFGTNHSIKVHEPVEIGSDVWIGTRAIIKGGIKIGHGSIIAAGAVVTKDVPAYSIVGGVPAKVIRSRFNNDLVKKLLISEWWNIDINKLRKHIPLMNDPIKFVDSIL